MGKSNITELPTARPRSALDRTPAPDCCSSSPTFAIDLGFLLTGEDDEATVYAALAAAPGEGEGEDYYKVTVPLKKFLLDGIQFWATTDQAFDGLIGQINGQWDVATRNQFIDRMTNELNSVVAIINSWKYPDSGA